MFPHAAIAVFASLTMIASSAVLMSAFEAHVVNVTATIEMPPHEECPALSIGYWTNHEGCDGGKGENVWAAEVAALSTGSFSGVFGSYSGADVCVNLSIPECPKGNSIPSKLCKAKAQTLADELNVVSGRLDLNAWLAGADDGESAFDNLGLAPSSKVFTALAVIESILANASSTANNLTDATYVAQRIYAFYEDENPNAPMCIYEWPLPAPSGAITSPGVFPEAPPEETENQQEEPQEPVEESPANSTSTEAITEYAPLASAPEASQEEAAPETPPQEEPGSAPPSAPEPSPEPPPEPPPAS